MITVRFLLLGLLTTMIANRFLAKKKSQNVQRVQQKEFRYKIIMGLAFFAIAMMLGFIVKPEVLAFAQLQFTDIPYWLGCVLMFSATSLWIWSKLTLGNNWSPRISIREKHELVTKGPYYWVRHPMYTSYVIQVLGMFFATANLAIVIPCTIIAFLTLRRASSEESVLINEFGDDYRNYQRKTGKFFPKLFRGNQL